MITAEELCRIEYDDYRPENIFMERSCEMKWAIFMMKKFAQLHVEAALKAAHINHQLPIEDLEFTLDCYPLTNIK